MDISQYLDIFIDESNEHLQNLNTQILNLESDPENMDTINEIFRAAHSLKGMAGTMGYKRMQTLTHDMENVFSEVRNGNIKVTPNMVDILFQCLDALDEYVNNVKESADEGTNDNEPLIRQLNSVLNGSGKPVAQAPAEAKEKSGETGDSRKWTEIQLDSAQQNVIQAAMEQGKNVYGLTVTVQESCILKAARAFLVFKAVEEKGEIIVSSPSAQDVEDEKFDLDFSLIVISEAGLEDVKSAAANVSEIASVVGDTIVLENMERKDKYGDAASEPEPQTESVYYTHMTLPTNS
ncbi:MAG: Hpt domain-containing protein, partial [Acetatifactor sp.]|nr:Hpt domain-containing protein [Acetatifactor sp.]